MKKVYIAIDLYHNIRVFSTIEKAKEFINKQSDCFTWHIQTTKIDIV